MDDDTTEVEGLRAENAWLRERLRQAALAEQRLAVEHEVSRQLALANDADDALDGALRAMCEGLGFDCCVVWLPLREEALHCARFVAAPGDDGLAVFEKATRERSFTPGEGVVGRVWRSGRPVWLEDAAEDAHFARAGAARRAGLRSALVTPIVGGGACLGVIECFFRERTPTDIHLLSVMEALGADLGQFQLRARARQQLRDRESRLRALVEDLAEAILTLDEHGVVDSCNPAAGRLFGCAPHDLVGRNVRMLVREPHSDAGVDLERPLPARATLEGRRLDGGLLPLDVSLSELRRGERRGYTMVLRELSESERRTDALRAAEAASEHAQRSARVATWVVEDGRVIVSAPFQELLEMASDAEPTIASWLARIHPEDRKRVVREAVRALETGRFEPIRFRVPSGSGMRWLVAEGNVDAGRIAGVTRDVTEQALAEQALRDSEERFRMLADAAPVLIAISQADGRVIANAAARRFVGVPDGELEAGDDWARFIHPEDRGRYLELAREARATARPYEIEFRLRRHDGVYRWMRSVAQPHFRADGALAAYVGATVDVHEQRAAEVALRASNERLREIYENAATGIAILELDGHFVQCNDAYCEIVGYSEEELRSLRSPDLVHPEDRAENLELLRHLIDGEESQFEIENRYVHRSGRSVWVHKFLSLLRDEWGRPAYLVALVTDIDQRKRQEARLAEQARLLDLTDDAILVRDGDERVTYWNRGAEHVYGWSRSAALGRRVHDLLQTRFPKPYEEIRRELQRAGSWTGELRQTCSDGREIVTLARWVVDLDEEGHPAFVLESNNDISDRKRAELALREREQRYRAIFENAAAGVIVVSPELRLVRVNDTFCRITGYACDELLSRPIADITHPEDRERDLRALERLREGSAENDETEKRYVRPDGSVVWVRVSLSAERDADGALLNLIGVVMDVTDRKRFEQELRAADRRKDEFLAMLGHELRNPLAPIRNAAEILRLARTDPHALETARTIIERQVEHLSRLVDDLLDVSRVSRGLISLKREPLDLADVTRQAIEAQRPLLESRGHELRVTLPAAPLRVLGDLTRLVQVLSNLLGNAGKYTDPGGRIEVVLAGEGEGEEARAVVCVRDSGRGIDASALPHLFELFFQVDRNLDRSDGGLGIGLSLVKSLVEMHGGSVEARSAGLGFGSEFSVRLPLIDTQAPPVDGEATASHGPRPLRVLIGEDQRDAAQSLALLLELEGHEVSVAHDGAAAVEIARAERPDVVLLDIGLPKLDGLAACREMRRAGLGNTLIIALSGYGQPDDRRASREAGFDAHWVKPVDLVSLRDLLARRAQPD